MIYKFKDMVAMIPSGGKIVSMCEHKGMVMLATESHVFRGSFETGEFEQQCFRLLEEDQPA